MPAYPRTWAACTHPRLLHVASERSPGGRQLLELLPVLQELGQPLLDLLLANGVVIGQLPPGVQHTLAGKNASVNTF